MTSSPDRDLAATGVSGLDEILRGGLPRRRLYLLQGNPGVGKTTLGLQFLLEGRARGESTLYVTLSETQEELREVAASHGWSLDGIALHQLSTPQEMLEAERQNTLFHPAEVELNETIRRVMALVDEVKPTRIVFDSLSELRLLAGDSLRYRRQILGFKQHFAGRSSTVLFLDDGTGTAGDTQLESIAHGVILLTKQIPDYGAARRRVEVVKLRSVGFISGSHDMTIEQAGLRVFPRLVASEQQRGFTPGTVTSDRPELDALLGGGLVRGTSTLLLGPAGTGKSSVSLQYVRAGIERGEKPVIFSFDENHSTLVARAAGTGVDLEAAMKQGKVILRQVDPAELSPGEFADVVRRVVEQTGSRIVVIDSLNGYLMAMPDERFLLIHMHELLTYLSHRGVTTLLVVAQHGLVGTMQAPVDVTYLADTVLLFRFFEAGGKVRKALSVLKKRIGSHEDTIREFAVGADGIRVGPPLSRFRGILTGTPEYSGVDAALLEEK